VSAYVDPPDAEPAPVQVDWAPPPMLTEPPPPPPPRPDYVWVGGYWVWEGNWVWAYGHWLPPPHPRYHWINPYYEHRDDHVIFIPGFWGPPNVGFRPPPSGIHIEIGFVLPGVIRGRAPIGPPGVFVPPPPGSRWGLIVPSPIGTPPAVVIGAPPVVSEGMHITNIHDTVINNTVINNTTVRVTNVRIEAPAQALASGHAYSSSVPAVAGLAAARPPMVRAQAPPPASTRPIASYVPGVRPPDLPAPRPIHVVQQVPAAPEHPAAAHETHATHATHASRTATEHKPELTHAKPPTQSARPEHPAHPQPATHEAPRKASTPHEAQRKEPARHESTAPKKPAPHHAKQTEKGKKGQQEKPSPDAH
jgi:hypothetical protein